MDNIYSCTCSLMSLLLWSVLNVSSLWHWMYYMYPQKSMRGSEERIYLVTDIIPINTSVQLTKSSHSPVHWSTWRVCCVPLFTQPILSRAISAVCLLPEIHSPQSSANTAAYWQQTLIRIFPQGLAESLHFRVCVRACVCVHVSTVR